MLESRKESCSGLLSKLREQSSRASAATDELQHLHQEASSRVEQQYDLLIQNLSQALTLEKQSVLSSIAEVKSRYKYFLGRLEKRCVLSAIAEG